MYTLAFELPGLPKTTNKTRRNGHWSDTHKDTKGWKKQVWVEVLQRGKPKAPLARARLVLTRYSSVAPDYEGLVSTFKPLIDGLTENGVIANDTFDIIGRPDYRWVKAPPKEGRIRIEVYEVTEEAQAAA